MAVVAVVCVDDKSVYKIIRINLKRQGWVIFQAADGAEALEHVRQESADILIVANQGLAPMTPDELTVELSRDPGDGKVSVINLDVKAPLQPTIFSNPKGHLPPAVAVRPLDWLGRTMHL